MDKKEAKVNTEEKKGNIDLFRGRLKKQRIEAGITSQEALAKKVGVDRVTINYYENGYRKPDIEVFIKIADTLNVSYDYLLGYSKSPEREYHDTREITGFLDENIDYVKDLKKNEQDLSYILKCLLREDTSFTKLLLVLREYLLKVSNYTSEESRYLELFKITEISKDIAKELAAMQDYN